MHLRREATTKGRERQTCLKYQQVSCPKPGTKSTRRWWWRSSRLIRRTERTCTTPESRAPMKESVSAKTSGTSSHLTGALSDSGLTKARTSHWALPQSLNRSKTKNSRLHLLATKLCWRNTTSSKIRQLFNRIVVHRAQLWLTRLLPFSPSRFSFTKTQVRTNFTPKATRSLMASQVQSSQSSGCLKRPYPMWVTRASLLLSTKATCYA